MDIGLLLLRVLVGALFVGHGTQKLFGWFSGPGRQGTTQMFDSLGYRRPREMAIVGGTAEAGGGALLALGLLTPFAAAAIIGVMVNAIVTVHWDNGLWSSDGGYEYNLVLIAVAAAFAFIGPGAWSLDAALDLTLAGTAWGLLALLLGFVGAAAALALREVEAAPTGAEESTQGEERRAA